MNNNDLRKMILNLKKRVKELEKAVFKESVNLSEYEKESGKTRLR